MEWPAVHACAGGPADHQRYSRAPAVVDFGGHVHNLVEPAGDEIHELHLRHRTHTHQCRAHGSPHDGGFANGGVDDSFLAEPLQHSGGHFERAAVSADVLAEKKNRWISLHLLPDALANRFKICQQWHGTELSFSRRIAPPALIAAIDTFCT